MRTVHHASAHPLLTAALGALLIACGGSTDEGLPELREDFVMLAQQEGVILNAATSGFNVDVVGLDATPDGQRVAALVVTGAWSTTFTEQVTFNPSDGSFDSQPGGSVTSVATRYELHVSEDHGATYRKVPVTPGNTALVGWIYGLFWADDHIYATVAHQEGRELVELDPVTGRYEVVVVAGQYETSAIVGYRNMRAIGGRLLWLDAPEDRQSFHANVIELATKQRYRNSIQRPACIPWFQLGSRPYTHGSIATSSALVRGLCTNASDEVCTYQWELDLNVEEGTSMRVDHCVASEAFKNLQALERDGVRPEFDPVFLLPTPAGLYVVGNAEYEGTEWLDYRRAVAVLIGDGALADVVDFGRGDVRTPDDLWVQSTYGGLIQISARCNESRGGRCVGATEVPFESTDRYAGWNPVEERLTLIPIEPSACQNPARCAAQPERILRLSGVNDQYLSSWRFSTGLSGKIERGVAVGYVTSPFYTGPEMAPSPVPASDLEMRCWAELACQPEAFSAGEDAIWNRVNACIDRWTMTRGVPDQLWLAFGGAARDDCTALRAADPVGFAPSGCAYNTCDATGAVLCGIASCAQLNGGTCSAIDGVDGCFSDACTEAAGDEYCDANGRLVNCAFGIVDDCAARGLTCDAQWGCVTSDPTCMASGSYCDGNEWVSCITAGESSLAQRLDCERRGLTCTSDGCFQPTGANETPRCDGEELVYFDRVIDCGALGLACSANPTYPANSWCVPAS